MVLSAYIKVLNKRNKHMKEWNFTFTDNEDGSWGWNSVWARGKKSAVNKATKKIKTFGGDYTLNVDSLNTNENTYNQLMRMFW